MKPDWKDAPDWAEWLAQDKSGEWWWYGKTKPHTSSFFEMWLNGRLVQSTSKDYPNPNWRNTLERRPKMKDYAEVLKKLAELNGPVSSETIKAQAPELFEAPYKKIADLGNWELWEDDNWWYFCNVVSNKTFYASGKTSNGWIYRGYLGKFSFIPSSCDIKKNTSIKLKRFTDWRKAQ